MHVDFHLEGGDDIPSPSPVLRREEASVSSSSELPATAAAGAGRHLQRALWILLGYGLARVDLPRWAGQCWQEAVAAEHKGLFMSVMALLVTLYVLCILVPINAVAEWDTHLRGGSGGRRPPRIRRHR